MTIIVNGGRADCAPGLSLDSFLEGEGYDQRVIVVGLNGTIVPKGSYPSVRLDDGDALEILNFVSGG
ncbi:MAG: sulfur carrier protein ThiS [Clostridiales Family XIII bacterium]|jgi:thiamine biosynthesis protein ThiS|nr:sulfur carrier protein ThiS [Clostridiales Family XIII bacterium]